MNSLLNIVKEQGIVDIITDYKKQFEYADWGNRMDKELKELEDIKKIKENKYNLLQKCSAVDEDGQHHYNNIFIDYISEKITETRKRIMKLQIEKLLNNYEEDEPIEINSEGEPIHIGITSTEYDMGVTLGVTSYVPY